MEKRKVLCMMVAFCMLTLGFLLSGERVKAAEETPASSFEYEVLDDGTIEITKFSGIENDVVVPEKINGTEVTSLGSMCFSQCSDINSVYIPDSIKNVGEWCFYQCENLISVKLPKNMKNIGEWTFKGCKNLKNIQIPENVTSIGERAFSECSSLIAIQIPEGVKRIGIYAFSECSNLKTVNIPENMIINGEFDTYEGIEKIVMDN